MFVPLCVICGIYLSALRHRLYANCRGHSLHIFRIPGRCFSANRVDRSRLQSVSSSEDNRGISRHCFGMVCFALSTYAESRFICRIPTIPRHRTNIQGIAHRGRGVGCFPFAVLCQTEYIVIQSVRLRGDREIQSSACHDCTAFRCFGAQLFRAQIHTVPLFGINRLPTVRATPLIDVPPHLLPRRVRSDGRTLRRVRLGYVS